jgi:hypothetical protein
MSRTSSPCSPRRIAKIGLMVVCGIAVLGGLVMGLWNWLMPALFDGVREISFIQALGLLLLSKILFGGFRGRGHFHGHFHRRFHGADLSEEERQKLHGGWHRWCCHGKGEKQESKQESAVSRNEPQA